ncbi:MAG: AmmeMemoRadiSam system protein A [Holophaga sp.]|nr:AmmeMemoRadiSam system protein A [Holophaga sp.]
MHSPECSLFPEHQRTLLELAKASIRHGIAEGTPIQVELAKLPPELVTPRATFVTLEQNGGLRGCIGCLEAHRPLAVDIAANAFAAAFRDTRFSPVRAEEIDGLEIHLSLLTQPEPLLFTSEADLISQLVPGRDGLILEEGWHRGTFLPSVWESLPDPKEFLHHLKRKAGLSGQHWSSTLRVQRYRAEIIPGP